MSLRGDTIATPGPGLALTTRVPDRLYWKEQISCQNACPVRTDSRGYVRAIADGDYERAYLIARGPNPLASNCGRVCGAPCETACRRGELDKAISIRALKRFVCERFGAEARKTGGRGLIEFLKEAATRHLDRPDSDRDELLPLLQALTTGGIPPATDRSVGVIGSGPAGLAAAHDLALLGLKVTLYEMEPVVGGMLAVGVPEYRLPRALIQAEIDTIIELGVTPVTGCQIGQDLSFAELRGRHDAVVIAVGAKRSRPIDLPGSDAEGVIGGVEFLRDVSIGRPPALGTRVVVVGGGNVAYDVGRSVLRQISVDTARTALRESQVARVHLCSMESLDEMPADDVEILEGDEEGIVRVNGVGPAEILRNEQGRVRGITLRRCVRVYDDQHRFAPVFDETDRQTIECDSVLLAIGQSFDVGFVDPQADGVAVDARGRIDCDPQTGRTSAPDIFIAGDLAYGTRLLIDAVASGKRVARAVYQTLTGQEIEFDATELHLAIPDYRRERGYERIPRVTLPTASVAKRIRSQSAPVEEVLPEDAARREASRCLDCGVNTIFDGTRCILCGGCVDVCPELCLRIVSADRVVGEPNVPEALANQLGDVAPSDASAILKDETICIRCGLCAERCPTGAITMERFRFEEVPRCRVA